MFAQMTFSCKSYVDFVGTVDAPRLAKGFGRLQYFNIQGIQYDGPPLPEAENSMTHPIGKAENIVTHPLCAPTHSSLYLLTGPLHQPGA